MVHKTLVVLTHGDDFTYRVEAHPGVTYDEARRIVQSKLPDWAAKIGAKLPDWAAKFVSFEVRASSSDKNALIASWGSDSIEYQAYENECSVVVDEVVLYQEYV